MKNIFTLLAFFFTMLSFKAVAQTNPNCNPQFSFVVSGNTVQFMPADTATQQFILYHSWSFGDGSAAQNVVAPTHAYSDTGTYVVVHYYFKALPGPGAVICSDSVKETIKITTLPCNVVPAFTWKLDSLNHNKVYFTNTTHLTSTAGITVNWFFGDDSSSTSWNVYHIYAKPGKYYTCLRIQTSANCYKYFCDSITIPATVVCNLQAYFNFNVDSSQYNKIHFNNYTQNLLPTDSTIWSFGDSTTSLVASPVHVFTQPGIYNVCLHVKRMIPGAAPCLSEFCRTVTVTAPCNLVVDYNYKKDSLAAAPNTYIFTDLSTPTNTSDSIYWNFGDGGSSAAFSPTHVFAQAGTYNVCLYVIKKSNAGTPICTGHVCKTITIAPACDFKIGYTWSLDSLNHNKVYFTNTSNATTAGTSVKWSFGDGTPLDSTWNTTHTFAQPGKYNVCLRIQLNPNCVKYQCDTITIPAATCNLKAAYTWSIDSVNHTKVYFTNTSNATAAGAIINWYFGDGTSDTLRNTTHTFTQPGKYYVCLRMQTAATCVSYQCDSITIPSTVVCNLQAYFYGQPDSLQSNKIHFSNYSKNLTNTDSSYWDFGDGSTSRDLNPTHIYANAGTYNACLTIKGITSPGTPPCTSIFCRAIVVTVPCNIQPSFSWAVDSLNHYKISVTNTSILNNTTASATWQFGDGSPLDSNWSTSHTYTLYGTYYVCLRIQTSAGCVKYYCDSIKVPPLTLLCNYTVGYTWSIDSLNPYKLYVVNTSTAPQTTSTVQWYFGDGTPLNADWNVAHTYKQPGKYYVCLVIETNQQCSNYHCDSITIPAAVICNTQAYFYDSADSVQSNKIYFTNHTTNLAPADSSYWDFGDGSTSRDTNPIHIYLNVGTYNACLTITRVTLPGTAPCISKFCRSVVVTLPSGGCDIQPGYTWRIDSVNHTTVNFTNTTATTSATALWYFGDGSSATSWNATHQYANAGKYYVCLRLQTTASCVKYLCDSITIPLTYTDCNHLSLFTATQFPADVQSYNFMPSYLNTDVKYTWAFGDNAGSLNAVATHRYNPGNYTACLTAYRNDNCASTSCKTIAVKQALNCDSIQLSYTYYKDGGVPNKVYFYTVTNSTLSQQTWSIINLANRADSASIANQANPTFIFSDTGYYSVCVRGVTANGCVKEYCNYIYINSVATSCELQAYPNPAQNQVSVNVQLDSPEMIHAYVYDIQSLLLLQTSQQGSTGTNVVTINTQNLATGFYTIKLIYGNKNCIAKFQKL